MIEPAIDRKRGFTAVLVHLRSGPPPSPDGKRYNLLAAPECLTDGQAVIEEFDGRAARRRIEHHGPSEERGLPAAKSASSQVNLTDSRDEQAAGDC